MNTVFVEGIDGGFPLGSDTWCCKLHRVCCLESLASPDGRNSIHRFGAPDTESVRRAIRSAGCRYLRAWSGFVYSGASPVVPDRVLVLAVTGKPSPHRLASQLRSLHSIAELASAYVSADGTRAIGFYWTAGAPQFPHARGEHWLVESSWPIHG